MELTGLCLMCPVRVRRTSIAFKERDLYARVARVALRLGGCVARQCKRHEVKLTTPTP